MNNRIITPDCIKLIIPTESDMLHLHRYCLKELNIYMYLFIHICIYPMKLILIKLKN